MKYQFLKTALLLNTQNLSSKKDKKKLLKTCHIFCYLNFKINTFLIACIFNFFSRNTPSLLLQRHTVDRAIYHLNQSHWNQYLVCDTADGNLYEKWSAKLIKITKAFTELTIHNFIATTRHYPSLSAKNLNKKIANTFKMVFLNFLSRKK